MEDNGDTKDEVLNVTVEEPKDLNIEGLEAANVELYQMTCVAADSWLAAGFYHKGTVMRHFVRNVEIGRAHV